MKPIYRPHVLISGAGVLSSRAVDIVQTPEAQEQIKALRQLVEMGYFKKRKIKCPTQ